MPTFLRRVVLSALCACVFAALGVQPAAAHTGNNHQHGQVQKAVPQKQQGALCKKAAKVRKQVIKKYDERKPGRDICKYGLRGGKKAPKPRLVSYLHTLKRIIALPVVARPAIGTSGATSVQQGSPAIAASAPVSGSLSAIAQCESGGDPTAVSPSGQYRGKYQFDYQTWQSVGGTGDPAAASEGEQDARAQALLNQRGANPWPVCGS